MPSGNATYTYVGEEPEITVSGQTFVKDEPASVADNGVIAMVSARKDFVEGEAEAKPKKAPAKK